MNDGSLQETSGQIADHETGVSNAPAGAYQVLARKYRPSSFDDLIGQDAMVQTLTNAFELDRIHQAYLLTGVRGVGKTTTARILARAFNYELPAQDGNAAIDKPTIDMKELGVHCQAIIESRHVDVIEMDAASHTGIDDVREIIESVRYKPVMARCKVYIIDEVHMLSRQAFNALLKTLEEPPEHVRFLFATTEAEKIPVTVRSRCQRFDLRRVGSGVMINHLQKICDKENVSIDGEALALVARAAEGSVRDSLSLLDQAIALSGGAGGAINADYIRNMLNIGSRSNIVDLFEALMKGAAGEALNIFKQEYDGGADPLLLLTDLAEFVHYVTRLKVAPGPDSDPAITEDERTRGKSFAESLSLQTLTLAWQIISKGLQDVKDSPRPMAAGDMVLVRLAYAANLPTPEDVVQRLTNAPAPGNEGQSAGSGSGAPRGGSISGGGGVATARVAPVAAAPVSAPRSSAATAPAMEAQFAAAPDQTPRVQLRRFEDVVALAHMRRDIQMKIALERDVHLIQFEQGAIEFALAEGASQQLAINLTQRLQDWTGERWNVSITASGGEPTIRQQQESREKAKLDGIHANPLVRSVLDHFPGAEIVSVDAPDLGEEPEAAAETKGGDEIFFDDALDNDDDDDA